MKENKTKKRKLYQVTCPSGKVIEIFKETEAEDLKLLEAEMERSDNEMDTDKVKTIK